MVAPAPRICFYYRASGRGIKFYGRFEPSIQLLSNNGHARPSTVDSPISGG